MQLTLFEAPAPQTDDSKDFNPVSNDISVDFETFYIKDQYGVGDQGIWHYLNDPRFDAYLVSVSDGTNTWVGHPRNFPWHRIQGRHWISHNAAFDGMVYARLQQLGIVPDDVRPSSWSCTANMAPYFGSERNLKSACEFLLGIKVDKEVRARMSKKHWQDAVNEGFAQELIEYGRSDAINCWKLWAKYGSKWPAHEQRLAQMTLTQGLRGFYVDRPYLGEALRIVKARLWEAQQSLPKEMRAEIDNGKTGISTKALAQSCRTAGIPVPVDPHTGKVSTSEDNEAFDDWVEAYKVAHPWVKTLNDVRKLNIVLGRLQTMQSRIRPDGCMCFELKYFNAGTGRWAGGGGYSVHNLLKSNTVTLLEPVTVGPDLKAIVVKDKGDFEVGDVVGIPGAGLFVSSALEKLESEKLGAAWPYGKLREAYRVSIASRLHPGHLADGTVIPAKQRAVLGGSGIDVRGMIMPRPGHKFVICDLSQIEPRVLAWLTGNTELLQMIKDGMAIYEAHARVSMGWTGGDLKKQDKSKYAMAKVRVLGLGYGCGSKKFKTIAKIMGGIDLTEEQSKSQVDDFRASNQPIVKFWKQLDLDMRRSLGDDFKVQLPSGRELVYNGVFCDKGEYYATCLNRGVRQAKKMYGGLLVENAVQAAARDVFAEGCLRLLDLGVEVVFHVHDEAVCEVPLTFDRGIVEKAMTITPEWLEGCPLAAEAEEADRYKK